MKEIKLGTIGSGSIVHSFLDGVKATDGISCEAVYSRTSESGTKLADQYDVKKLYTNMEEFMSDQQINCVYVASPNNLHYEQSKLALLHNKNVICEKPFCTKREQIEELIALAKERHLFLVDATPTAFLPNFEIIKQQLPKAGRVRLVMCNYSQYSSRYDQVLAGQEPNVFSKAFAGGSLQDINYYNVYFNVALFGKPEKAIYYPNICSTGVDSSGIIMLQYRDFISSSAGAKDTWGVNYAQIEGEKGYIYVENGGNKVDKVRVVTNHCEETLNMQEDSKRLYYEVQNITKAFLSEDYEGIYKKLETTVAVIEVIEGARKQAGILFPGDLADA